MLAALLFGFLLLAIAGWFLGRWPAKAGQLDRWLSDSAYRRREASLLQTQLAGRKLGSEQLPTTRNWQPWSAEAVTRYQSQGRPVFVDFTASWCLPARSTSVSLSASPEVQKAFADTNVVLMRADWTRYDDNITRTLNSLGRSGVPTYALYVPGESQPRLLPEVLTPGIVTNALAPLTQAQHKTRPLRPTVSEIPAAPGSPYEHSAPPRSIPLRRSLIPCAPVFKSHSSQLPRSCCSPSQPAHKPEPETARVNALAPAFKATDSHGQSHSLDQYKGK